MTRMSFSSTVLFSNNNDEFQFDFAFNDHQVKCYRVIHKRSIVLINSRGEINEDKRKVISAMKFLHLRAEDLRNATDALIKSYDPM